MSISSFVVLPDVSFPCTVLPVYINISDTSFGTFIGMAFSQL